MNRRRVLMAALGLLALFIALVDVTPPESRIHVRWLETITPTGRAALERRYHLANGELVEGSTWRYELRDRSRKNVDVLMVDRAVADIAYIEEAMAETRGRRVRVTFDRVRALAGPAPSRLLQLQSVVLIAAGGALLWAAGSSHQRRRRDVTLAVLFAIGVAAYALPLHQDIRMGDAETYTGTRERFDEYTGVRQIRFEAHLSHAILGRLAASDPGLDAAARAFRTLMRAGTAWFLAMALTIGVIESWSPVVVRYLALAVIGPSALLFFGYRELGQLSLNLAVFPLALRGLRAGSRHLEGGSALAGVGAALHGFGLLSVAGLVMAALVRRKPDTMNEHAQAHGVATVASTAGARIVEVIAALLRILPWSLACYLGWVAIYLIVLRLPMVPGHADAIPFRPLAIDQVGDRLNAAIVSARGLRDIVAQALLVGMPLVAVAASLRRQFPFAVRAALLYALPSAIFVIAFWPIQGLAVEMDLLFAAFPAIYALAWVCAHDARRAVLAAALLAVAHIVFWRVVLDTAFVNSRI